MINNIFELTNKIKSSSNLYFYKLGYKQSPLTTDLLKAKSLISRIEHIQAHINELVEKYGDPLVDGPLHFNGFNSIEVYCRNTQIPQCRAEVSEKYNEYMELAEKLAPYFEKD